MQQGLYLGIYLGQGRVFWSELLVINAIKAIKSIESDPIDT